MTLVVLVLVVVVMTTTGLLWGAPPRGIAHS